MKKQVKKAATKKPAAKTQNKKAAPKNQEDQTPENNEQPPQPEPQPQPEQQPQEQPQAQNTPQEPVEVTQAEEQLGFLTLADRQKLQFKYGARILEEDLIGTKDEVAEKISKRTGEESSEIRKFID